MNDFLNINLPCGDIDIEIIEKALGIKFQRVYPEESIIPKEKIDVCPMSMPSSQINYFDTVYNEKR